MSERADGAAPLSGGATWESGKASERLVDALRALFPDLPDAALAEVRAAGSDLAAAAGTAATSKMAGPLGTILMQLKTMSEEAERRHGYMLNQLEQHFENTVARLDSYGREIDRQAAVLEDNGARLGKLAAEQAADRQRLFLLEARLTALEAREHGGQR